MPSNESLSPEPQILMSGLAFPESPRWHEDRLWFSDWGAHEVIAVDLEGKSEVIVRVRSFPMCIDRLPDGRLLIVSASEGLLLRREPDGSLVTHADLTGLADHKWNDIVVDGRGNAFVNNTGFDFPGGEFAPGIVALVTPDGSARQVADGVAFPNGMVVTPDNSTLIVAESYGNKLTAFDMAAGGSLSNRRLWADLRGGTGRERNQVLDAGDVLSLLRRCGVDIVLSGHRHVPYVWPIAGMLLIHSGTVSTLRTRGFPDPAYNLVRIEGGRIAVELCVPGGERQSLGDYPRDWPVDLSAAHADPFVRAQRGVSLADDRAAPSAS